MPLLRVLLPDAPLAGRADAWALYSDDGARLLDEGTGAPSTWPAAARREAVIGAARTRLITLDLPPIPADRLPSAVAFALEDQLASDAPPRIATGAPGADGRVDAAIADPALVDGVVADADAFARIVPEMALAPADAHWTWYASAVGGGFVRTPSGAFAVDASAHGVPPELAVALAQAQRGGETPGEVRVAFACDGAMLDAFAAATGIAFVPVTPWRWATAAPARFALAPDWRAVRAQPLATPRARAAWFRPAIALALAAFVLHALGTLLEWAGWHVALGSITRDQVTFAQAAGVTDTSTPAGAVAGVMQRHAEALHRAGRAAPADALPLLAAATPGLAALPAGTLKSASYGGGAWTFDLGAVDPARLQTLDAALGRAGLGVVQAPAAGGTRVRITPLP